MCLMCNIFYSLYFVRQIFLIHCNVQCIMLCRDSAYNNTLHNLICGNLHHDWGNSHSEIIPRGVIETEDAKPQVVNELLAYCPYYIHRSTAEPW